MPRSNREPMHHDDNGETVSPLARALESDAPRGGFVDYLAQSARMMAEHAEREADASRQSANGGGFAATGEQEDPDPERSARDSQQSSNMEARNECEYQPDGSVKIKLTQGQYAYIDVVDLPIVAPYRWCAWLSNHSRGTYYARTGAGPNRTHMHMIILPPREGMLPDHIDNDGLNNRRSNLRYTTPTENQRNRRKASSDTSSRFKGVTFDKRRGVWRADIQLPDNRFYLGSFASEELAAKAYDHAARKLFGPHARLNFPKDGEQPAIDT